MKTDLFQSCGHCWVFQICWHIECSTFTASSLRFEIGLPRGPRCQVSAALTCPGRWEDSRESLQPERDGEWAGPGPTLGRADLNRPEAVPGWGPGVLSGPRVCVSGLRTTRMTQMLTAAFRTGPWEHQSLVGSSQRTVCRGGRGAWGDLLGDLGLGGVTW